MRTFEEIYQARTIENYDGICDGCGAPIVIKEKFLAVLILQDDDWDYHLLVSFVIYCFACKRKLVTVKLNRHPFEVSAEFDNITVKHEHR